MDTLSDKDNERDSNPPHAVDNLIREGISYELTYRDVIAITEIINAANDLEEFELTIGRFRFYASRRNSSSARRSISGSDKSKSNVTLRTESASVHGADNELQQVPSADTRNIISADIESDSYAVTAPIVGIFYRSPEPGSPPFVEEGQQVRPDDVVGIIEVMKTMNTLKAGFAGTVERILVQNEQFVEYGQAIMYITPGCEVSEA